MESANANSRLYWVWLSINIYNSLQESFQLSFLLDCVEALLTETLNSLSSFEGVDEKTCELPQLHSWTYALPSRLAAASGSGAAPSTNAGYVIMHISDLLAILQPLVSLYSSTCSIAFTLYQ